MTAFGETQTKYGGRAASLACVRDDLIIAPFVTDVLTGGVELIPRNTDQAIRAISGMAVIETEAVVAASQVNVGFYRGASLATSTLLYFIKALVAPVSGSGAIYTVDFKFDPGELEDMVDTETESVYIALSGDFLVFALPVSPFIGFQAVGTFSRQRVPTQPG